MKDEDFFGNSEVEDIASSHINSIRSLEDREAKRILKTYKNVRQELRDRLEMVEPGTFSAQKMQGTLYQIDIAIRELSRNLRQDFSDSAEQASLLGIENLIRELNKFNKVFSGAVIPINVNAAAIASDTRNFLFNQYESSVNAYSETLRARMARGLTEAVVAQDNINDVMSKIGKTFLGEEWKLQQIVRTELHSVYNQGKIKGMTELWKDGSGDIPDLMKTLFHPMDARTGEDSKRLSQNNPIVPVDEPFVEYSTGKRLEYMAPPNRPNDRAILIPYRKVWKDR